MAHRSSPRPFARLLRDTAGNTLAIMGMAIFPLAGLVGGGVDMSRLYLTKARLQQACDAGALAGRKVMGSSAWTYNDNAANRAAEQFFAGNFKDGAYGTSGLTRSFSESAGKVTGNASVRVPMTIMRIFGSTEQTIAVTCDAELRLPNTDIMFVLDTTGSMAGRANAADPDTKIVVLKKAVKCFYETVARLDTDAVCGTGAAPSGGTGDQTQIRFGFVPYATNANVGKLLPAAYFANSWPYQSRKPITQTETYYTYETPGTPTVGSTGSEDIVNGPSSQHAYTTGGTETQCRAAKPADSEPVSQGPEGAPYNTQTTTGGATQTVTWNTKQPYKKMTYTAVWDKGKQNNKPPSSCTINKQEVSYNLVRSYSRTDAGTANTRQVFKQWHYGKINTDISGLKNGTGWNAGFNLPIGNNGVQRTITWDGCIEERATVRRTSYSPIPSAAKDLDIDLVPTAGDPASLWGPALDELIYVRQVTTEIAQMNVAEIDSAANYYNDLAASGWYTCPREASKLRTYPLADDLEGYVDSLTTGGNTYHDIGMILGARFLSSTGIFASENATTARGAEIERHMIFMTDGETCTSRFNYAAYGMPYYDRRQTDPSLVPTDGCSNASSTGGTLSEQVDARFTALCTAVKNKNITLWVVYFGTTDATTTARMTNCATSGRFFPAANQEALLASFRTIADQISQLRLTQ